MSRKLELVSQTPLAIPPRPYTPSASSHLRKKVAGPNTSNKGGRGEIRKDVEEQAKRSTHQRRSNPIHLAPKFLKREPSFFPSRQPPPRASKHPQIHQRTAKKCPPPREFRDENATQDHPRRKSHWLTRPENRKT
jgi:hypothetical protein